MKKSSMKFSAAFSKFMFYFGNIVIGIIFVSPLIWMISASLKPESQIFANMNSLKTFFPVSASFNNYVEVFARMNLPQVFKNTLLYIALILVLDLLVNSMCGYALAKFEFKGKGIIFGFIMGSMMIPSLVMYVPLFEMMIELDMTDSHWAVILPLLANAFGIFLMRQNMLNFPTALMEAGRIDGVSELGIFARIVLPNIKPALGALVIYMFTSMWNNFMWPLIILGSEDKYTLPIALAMLDGNPTNKDYAVILLATAVATLPILIIFLVFQKQFVAGVMGGAVKE